MTITKFFPTARQEKLFYRSISTLERLYDDHMKLIRSGQFTETNQEKHSSRDSIHYALGLLLRNESGDVERACDIIMTILDMQFRNEEEIFYGTFSTSPQAPLPPSGNFPWQRYGEGVTYFLHDTFQKFQAEWLKQEQYSAATNAERQEIREQLTDIFEKVIPPVWKSYDPNWREFIASTFAVILELCEFLLPTYVVHTIDEAMHHTVQGSIDRKVSDAIPMNTNIELMHLFIVDYFAHRYNNAGWATHAAQHSELFLEELEQYGTFAEFNSATYYGVDLTVLGLMRKYSKLEGMKRFAAHVEQQLWSMIAAFYNAELQNLAGPYSRAYEMDIPDHSSLGVFLYLALGEKYEHLAADNCETAHNMLLSLLDVSIPEPLDSLFLTHHHNRPVSITYRELCERHEPGDRRYDCQATAWIERNLMLGGLAGSQNTSGQLHPATIHWQNEQGHKYYLRLLRREPGGQWSTHYRGVLFNAVVQQRSLSIDVSLSADHDLEVFFEITGEQLGAAHFDDGLWHLPGLALSLEDQGTDCSIKHTANSIEHIYYYHYTKGPQMLRFQLDAQLTYD